MIVVKSQLATVNSTVAPGSNGLKYAMNNGDSTSGTYIHPELGILLARYLIPKFARACDKFVKDKMKNKVQPQSFDVPKTFSEALLLAADQAKTIEVQEIEMQKQAVASAARINLNNQLYGF